MAFDVIVPEVGEVGMEVIFVRWLKAEGDDVAIGDPLFEVDTEKAVMEVEAYAAGILTDLAVSDGDTVQTRQVIAHILAPGEQVQPAAAPPAQATPRPGGSSGTVESSSAVPATGSGTGTAGAPGSRRAGVSPRARRVARELGVDTEGLAGNGPDGLITEADVRAAAEHSPAQPLLEDPTPAAVERARRVVADLTSSSWQTIPHFYLQLEADVDRGLGLAKPTALVCASVAQALSRHPECNLRWDGDRPVRRQGVALGLLVDTPAGLLIAVIGDAQHLDLTDMAEAITAATKRARTGKLSTDDLVARSMTISNLGMFSVDRFSAVISKPDVMTLAVGRTRTVPRWDGSAFRASRAVDLTLSVDHRGLDGAAAARFMSTLESVLADPAAEGLA